MNSHVDVNNILSNYASELRARSARCDARAAELEAQAVQREASPTVEFKDYWGASRQSPQNPGLELGRQPRAEAAEMRERAALARLQESYASKGQYLHDMSRPVDPEDQAIAAVATKHRRTIALNPRDRDAALAPFLAGEAS